MAIFDYANKRIGQCCRLKIYSTFFVQKGVEKYANMETNANLASIQNG